jgi:DNA-binding CsgD family transcriptional regulator
MRTPIEYVLERLLVGPSEYLANLADRLIPPESNGQVYDAVTKAFEDIEVADLETNGAPQDQSSEPSPSRDETYRLQLLEAYGREWLREHAPGIYLEIDERARRSLEDYRRQHDLPSLEAAARRWLSQLPPLLARSRELAARWETLTEREQEVTGRYCLGYSAEETIRALPGMRSENTVRAHLNSARAKFGFKKIEHLKIALDGWDFSDFDKTRPR